jgi:hypothetical protein
MKTFRNRNAGKWQAKAVLPLFFYHTYLPGTGQNMKKVYKNIK